MLSEPIGNSKEIGEIVTVLPGARVAEAVSLMLAHGVGAVGVVDSGALVGIFTEHDIVSRVMASGRDARSVRVDEVMTRDPLCIGPESTLGRALVLMQERGIRHLPVIEAGKPIGMVCARAAFDPALEDFISEERRRESFR